MARPDRVTDRIPEWKLQAHVAADLDRRIDEGAPFDYAASLEGVIGNLNPYQAQKAKATGVKRGEPDLRLYFDAGRIVFVELKAEGGRLTKEQKDRIPRLHARGFAVHVVEAKNEAQAVELVGRIVDVEIATPCGSSVLPTRWMPR